MDKKKPNFDYKNPPPGIDQPDMEELLKRLIMVQRLREAARYSDSPMGGSPSMMAPLEVPMSRGDVLSMYGNPRRQSIADKMGYGRK